MDYHKLFDLSGRTALVTGGVGILGQHFCRALAAFGATVVICDREQGASDELARALENEYGCKALGIGCDVGETQSVNEMVAEVIARFGGCDILLNNAASKTADLEAFFAPAEDYGLAAWRDVMRVNLDGMFLVARAVGRAMIERGKGGSIIQTSSIYGIVGADQRIYEGSHYMGLPISNPIAYSASKAGVLGLSLHLAAAWGARGIRVNTLVPGGVRSGQNELFVAKYSARVPMGRMGQAHELAGAAVYLASDASSYVTGQCLIVDGGLTAW